MKKEEAEAAKQFIRTTSAVLEVVLNLINDLAPIIGYDEAERLVNIIGKAQKGD